MAVGVANQVYWPEIYSNISIVAGGTSLSDTNTLTGASTSFDPQLFLGIDACAEHLLNGTAFDQNKYFPIEVAQWLEDWGTRRCRTLPKQKALLPSRTILPFAVLKLMSPFREAWDCSLPGNFAAPCCGRFTKRPAMVHAKTAALAQYDSARQAWSELAAVATPNL